MQDEQQPDLVGLSAEIMSAYVAKNHIQTSEISQLIASVHDALRNVAKPAPEPEKDKPPVPINKTIRPDYIISLEDGRRYKSLKRHLSSRDLPPSNTERSGVCDQLSDGASSYAKARSELAKAIGLGQKRSGRKRAAKKTRLKPPTIVSLPGLEQRVLASRGIRKSSLALPGTVFFDKWLGRSRADLVDYCISKAPLAFSRLQQALHRAA